jgi:DNA-binding MarR family transcriptional regulator
MAQPTPFPIELGSAARASRALLDARVAHADLVFTDWVVLRSLAVAGGTVDRETLRTDLAALLDLDVSGVAGLLDTLVSRALVHEVPPAGPGGGVAVQLTGPGEATYRRVADVVASDSAFVLSGIDPEDLATAAGVLRHVQARSRERVGA